MLQQVFGYFLLNIGEYDREIFTILMAVLISLGFAVQTDDKRKAIRNFTAVFAVLIGLPMIVAGLLVVNDTVNGTEVTGSLGIWFALDTISSQVAEWTIVIQTIIGIVPVVVVVIGVAMIFYADSPDEMLVPILETACAIGLMIFAAMGFGWLGISIF